MVKPPTPIAESIANAAGCNRPLSTIANAVIAKALTARMAEVGFIDDIQFDRGRNKSAASVVKLR